MNHEVGYQSLDKMSEGHEALFRKVEMSIFGGLNPYGWLAIAERYF